MRDPFVKDVLAYTASGMLALGGFLAYAASAFEHNNMSPAAGGIFLFALGAVCIVSQAVTVAFRRINELNKEVDALKKAKEA